FHCPLRQFAHLMMRSHDHVIQRFAVKTGSVGPMCSNGSRTWTLGVKRGCDSIIEWPRKAGGSPTSEYNAVGRIELASHFRAYGDFTTIGGHARHLPSP